MKVIKITALILLSLLIFFSCEKDDICVDGDTPLLVIRFYDKDNPEEVKPVTTLVVRGLNGTDTLGIITNISSDSIAIPLRPNMDSTVFTLSENLTPTDESSVNVDTITFSYETQEVFVSRACGFIANYDTLLGDNTDEVDPWITDIQIINPLVENSNSAHVKILH